jgi:Peptidase family S41
MSKKIYAFLLRLYPSHFREAYGDEALQLFRDRARDEKGFFPSLRLWLDLLADLAISVPREYGYVQPALVGASAQRRLAGVPAFHVLQGESPRPGALLFGSALSLVVLSTFWILLGHGAGRAGMGVMPYGQFPGRSGFSQRQPAPQDSASATDRADREVSKLDPAERRRVIDAVVANLRKHYIDPAVAQKTADALLAHEKNGDDDAVTDAEAFAGLLTRQIRDVSHDMHLDVLYSQNPLPEQPLEPTPETLARYRNAMDRQHCMFEQVQILPHNIGYLKLNSFTDPSACRPTATAAMASLNHVDAIIFDLRDNRGGEPAMVALMAAYLFDHPEYWYNPRENTTEHSWTLSPVPGNRLADKPAYVLTSARTLSGAEQFCYDLKMLKRATLVGETTGGSAHSGVFHRIDDHFGMGIPETRSINPFSKTDWAETGVEPDVKVNAADALATAVNLAETKLHKN